MDHVIKQSAGNFGYITHDGDKNEIRRETRKTTQLQRPIERRVHDLTFADDIALFENNNTNQQNQINELKRVAAMTGLEINVKKTVQMRLNDDGNEPNIMIDNQPVEIANEFKYLGSHISSTEKDVNSRIALAWVAFDKLKDILRARTQKLTINTKFRLYNAACISILLYGCESWVLTEKDKNKLDVFHRTCLRIMMGYNQNENHMTNEELYTSTGQRKISDEIIRRQLQFTGHCLRMKPEEPVNTYVLYESKRSSVGQRGKGRPRLTYLAQIASYINVQKDNETVSVISRYASDRKDWKKLIGGSELPKPAINSVLDAPGKLAR